jgi:hypothetical protein
MTTTTYANGLYAGTFRWGRSGEADVQAVLRKNDHGWFCLEVNGREWVYPTPGGDPWGGWGAQVAKETPLEAVRGFLRQWDANADEHGVSTAADRLTITPVIED